MKTPDEIKTGVEFCTNKVVSGNLKTCDLDCPYRVEGLWCRNALAHDTLAYIQQLEEKYKRAMENAKILSDAVTQLERERDAMKRDLYFECYDSPHACYICKYGQNGVTNCLRDLDEDDCFEWRGVQENGGAEDGR